MNLNEAKELLLSEGYELLKEARPRPIRQDPSTRGLDHKWGPVDVEKSFKDRYNHIKYKANNAVCNIFYRNIHNFCYDFKSQIIDKISIPDIEYNTFEVNSNSDSVLYYFILSPELLDTIKTIKKNSKIGYEKMINEINVSFNHPYFECTFDTDDKIHLIIEDLLMDDEELYGIKDMFDSNKEIILEVTSCLEYMLNRIKKVVKKYKSGINTNFNLK